LPAELSARRSIRRNPDAGALAFFRRRVARDDGTWLASGIRIDEEANMARSSLNTTGESNPVVRKGHGTGALGPSDSTDSGSDIVGGPGLNRDDGLPLQRGTLAVVSGRLAKQSSDAMTVRTPSAILGVRGTQFVVLVR
jgi:hypothetical protein